LPDPLVYAAKRIPIKYWCDDEMLFSWDEKIKNSIYYANTEGYKMRVG